MSEQSFVPILLALQFAAFGWRINREITLGDQNRRTWLPIPDYINVATLLLVVLACVIFPLATGAFAARQKVVLGMGYVLIAMHPVNVAAHYRLFSKKGRSVYSEASRDYPYITGQEIGSLILTLFLVAGAGVYIGQSPLG